MCALAVLQHLFREGTQESVPRGVALLSVMPTHLFSDEVQRAILGMPLGW